MLFPLVIVCALISLTAGVVSTTVLLRALAAKPAPAGADEPSEYVKFLGVEMRGTRSFVMFSCGVLLIILPLYLSVDLSKASVQRRPELSIVPPPEQYKSVATFPEPSYNGFHFERDIRVLDLRSTVPIPPDKRTEKYSPVTVMRYTLVKKLLPSHDTLIFEFGTTGVDVSPRCLTHRYQLFKSTTPHRHGDVEITTSWQLQLDVKDVRVNETFLVITEATYWNAFNKEPTEWFGMHIPQQTDTVGMVLLFPRNKPFKHYSLYAYARNEKKQDFSGTSTIIPSDNNYALLWTIDKPKVNHTYQIDWEW